MFRCFFTTLIKVNETRSLTIKVKVRKYRLNRTKIILVQVLWVYVLKYWPHENKEQNTSVSASSKPGYMLLPDGDLNNHVVQYFDVFDGHSSK
jgi:hypothetical protein